MNAKKQIVSGINFTGERAQYFAKNIRYENCTFSDGESPLKHTKNLEIQNVRFEYKYPLWNSENIIVKNSLFKELSRSGIWNTKNLEMNDTLIEAPKEFRRSENISLKNVKFTNAEETFWNCKNIHLENVQVEKGDYFAFNANGFYAENFNLEGNYFLDGGKNVEIHNSRIISKDAFWNCENVTVYDSYIWGEYLGWHSKNLKFVNCKIESDQGLCYIDELAIENCTFENTVLSFEYSTGINAKIVGKIDSVKNPCGGTIQADEIGTLILNPKRCNPNEIKIICPKIDNKLTKDLNPNEEQFK